MKNAFHLLMLAVAVAVAVLVGCGLKGPLYMPDGQPSNTSDTQKNTHQKLSMRP